MNELVLMLWVACAIIGAVITKENGRGVALGLILGGFLSVLGVIIAAVMGREKGAR